MYSIYNTHLGNNMNQNIEECIFSKKQVNKSGNFLAQNHDDINELDLDQYLLDLDQHLKVFNSWRSLHSYVMNVIYMNLKRRIQKLEIKEAIIAQRLKRTPSIINKLNRFHGMQLSRMQDIAGVRIIVEKKSDIYKIRDDLISKFPHIICDEDNYINVPKPDGYRCLHMIFKIQGLEKQKFNGLSVELQIRTELQHQWATAVEIIGLYKNTSYKSGLGDEKTREFLCVCSNLLALREGTPIDPKYYGKTEKDLCQTLRILNEELNVLDYLKGLMTSLKHHQTVIKKSKSKICLLLLKLDEKLLKLQGFKKVEDAELAYNALEREISQKKKNWDVVLISVNDMESLKKAYPNYYMDSQKFISTIKKFIKKF